MADGAPIKVEETAYRFGDDLDQLLAALRRADVPVGPREQVAAHTIAAELVARGRVQTLGNLRPVLRPLLARTAQEREAFDVVYDAHAPETQRAKPEPDKKVPEPVRRPWWRYAAIGVLALSIAALLAYRFWPPPAKPATPIVLNDERVPKPLAPAAAGPPPVEAPMTDNEALNRIAEAAKRFDGAPTLEELAKGLPSHRDESEIAAVNGKIASIEESMRAEESGQSSGAQGRGEKWQSLQKQKADLELRRLNLMSVPNSPIDWPAASYAAKFHEWTGLPLSVPIAIYGQNGRDGTTWAKLALALGRIEQPGREPTYAALLATANSNLAQRTTDQIPVAYRLAARIPGWLPLADPPGLPNAKLIQTVQARAATAVPPLGGAVGTPLAVDPFHVLRALAITEGLKLPAEFHNGAPWRAPRPPAEARYASPWTPVIAFLFPVAFAVFWMANSLALRKAYLRRRPPELPPLHMDIVSQIGRRISTGRGQFRRIAQRLQVRTPETTDRIDIPATITATIASGARFVTPAYAQLYRTPEYLVLIERAAVGDQETERLRSLIRRISDVVPVTIYTFQGDPAILVPERGNRPVLIEQVVAAHSDHRLIVLGAGEGFLDPVTLQARPAARKLIHFRHRVLLTPVPLAEWGREEFALAHELGLPIGRATPEGMERLAELMGLDGIEDGKLVDPRGDGLARALPEMLRVHPDRFFYTAAPSDIEVPQLIRELRNFLDAPGFEWLCALAVYPSVQWDLTLYLGVTLAEERGGDPAVRPLYREDRIAALTHLPWLREGAMPGWLRRALIVELGRAGRADEVREALKSLIEEARKQGDRRNEDDVVLRIAREQPKEGFDPQRLYDDEVLLDFMARGRVEDFALPRRTWLEAIVSRGLLDRIGVPGLIAGGVAVVYAAAAWWIAPKTNGIPWGAWTATTAPLVTGAWLPLAVLATSGIAALVVTNLQITGGMLRSALLRGSSAILAFAMLMLTFALFPTLPSQANFVAEAATFALSFAALLFARRTTAWLWMREPSPKTSPLLRLVTLLPIAFAIAATGWIVWVIAPARSGLQQWTFAITGTVALLLFATAWFSARRPTARVSHRPSKNTASRAWLAGSAKVVAALALIVPALGVAYHVSTASVALERAAPGSAVVAETSDGRFLAVGGADGRVQVYDTRAPHTALKTINTGLGAISSLALLARDPNAPENTLITATGGADGRIAVRFVTEGSVPSYFDWAEQPDAVSHGQAPQVALAANPLPGGEPRLLLAVETSDGRARLLAGARDDQRAWLNGQGSVTALTALDGGRFAFGTLDGGVNVATIATDGSVALSPAGGAALKFGASRARRLTFDVREQVLTAVGDDGSVIRADVRPDGSLAVSPATRDQRLALGRAVPFKGIAPQLNKQLLLFTHRSGLTPQAAVSVAQTLARDDIGIQISEHRDATAPDAVFIRSDARVAAVRSMIRAAKPQARFIFPVDYIDAGANELAAYQASFGLQSTHRYQSGNPFEAPYELTPDRLEWLVADDVTQEEFTRRLASLAPSRLPEMVVVPAGSFTMGSPASEEGRSNDEGPQRVVTFARPFEVGRFAVTFAEWDLCAANGGCAGNRAPADQGWGRGRRPVINVSWNDAQEYIAWLSAKTGKTYRLLSEAEWEYAARAGTATAYPWGSDIGRGNANCNGCGSQWDNKQTAPVGSFKPNAFGLHDMHGNVFQWVQDCYVDTYAGAPTDGSVTRTRECVSRVLRGGSWFSDPQNLRSAFRFNYLPDDRISGIGFRLARTLLPSP